MIFIFKLKTHLESLALLNKVIWNIMKVTVTVFHILILEI